MLKAMKLQQVMRRESRPELYILCMMNSARIPQRNMTMAKAIQLPLPNM